MATRGKPKGKPKTGGRQKGVVNKLTREVKDMILDALSDVGGVEYLKQRALDNPVAFLTLVGKVLPLQVTGPNNGPLQVETSTRPQLTKEEWLALHGMGTAAGSAD